MWALGIILYLLYFKTFRFDGKNSTEIKNRIYYDPKIKKNLKNLIDKLLDKDYNSRISCSDESFSEYFNDNDIDKSAFIFNRINNAKSTKKIVQYSSLKASDVKNLLDNIKNNNKK